MSSSIIILMVFILQLTNCEREHKVHNIILYPERHSWCQTTAIQQIVASPGYEPVTIDNTVCVGACYSYSIPSTQPAEPGELIGPYCDSCQPVETKCYHVTLQADGKNTDGPKTFQKRVQIIKKCSCTTCGKIQEDCDVDDLNTLELPLNLFTNHTKPSQDNQQSEIPELFHFVNDHKYLNFDLPPPPSPSSPNTTTKFEKFYELTPKLLNFLKNIQNGGADYDKIQLKELLKIIEGNDSDLNDKNLMEFVNYVNTHNTEDLELDLNRLKDVLKTYKMSQMKKLHHHHHHHQQHHLGDEIHVGMNLEHLIKGPHHSMVLAPDINVEEKLNIDSDILKPNHDGVIISYENHHQQQQENHQKIDEKLMDD